MTYNVQKAIMWLKKIAGAKYGRVLIDFSIITFLAVIIFRNWIFTSEWPAGGDILGWISREYLFGKDLARIKLQKNITNYIQLLTQAKNRTTLLEERFWLLRTTGML